MEKLICALWAPAGESRADFAARLIAQLPARLAAAGASGIRLNLRDSAVEPAAALLQQWQDPQQDAIAQFWLPSANAQFRQPIDALLGSLASRFELWLAAESTIIANTAHPSVKGQRSWGWSQASFISFLPDQDWAVSVRHWHSHHTRIAIETQANFEYIQNLIVRPLTETAPAYAAFVEECFPLAAMTDPREFFAAVGDDDKFARNTRAMAESCAGFIDFHKIDIIPTSQFDFAWPPENGAVG